MKDDIVFYDLVIAAKFNYSLLYKVIEELKKSEDFSYEKVIQRLKEYSPVA